MSSKKGNLENHHPNADNHLDGHRDVAGGYGGLKGESVES